MAQCKSSAGPHVNKEIIIIATHVMTLTALVVSLGTVTTPPPPPPSPPLLEKLNIPWKHTFQTTASHSRLAVRAPSCVPRCTVSERRVTSLSNANLSNPVPSLPSFLSFFPSFLVQLTPFEMVSSPENDKDRQYATDCHVNTCTQLWEGMQTYNNMESYTSVLLAVIQDVRRALWETPHLYRTLVFLNAHHHRRHSHLTCWSNRWWHCIGLSVLKHAFGIINVILYVLVII